MYLKVEEISKQEIIDLLCTATYGCDWLVVKTLKSEQELTKDIEDFDSREEKWALRLMKGGHIVVYDMYDESDDSERHEISLNDIVEGIAIAFHVCPKNIMRFISGDYDYIDCNNIFQVILFGKIVYG